MSSVQATVEIRRADRADVAALLQLMAVFDAEGRLGAAATASAEALFRLFQNPTWGAVLVADGDGALLGYALLDYGFDREVGGRDATLRELFVMRDARGRGLGKALLEAASGAARSAGAHALRAVVRGDDPRARRLYERRGFEADGRLAFVRPLDR